ncbi:MAG: hypothetical protein U0168_27850 [Nannocystaceae bacterium]
MSGRLVLATLVAMAPAAAAAAEPDAPGRFETVHESYALGDSAFVPTQFNGAPVELQAAIRRPADLTAGPFPLVIVLHGRHSTCFDPDIPIFQDPFANASDEWPCFGNHEPIPSLDGYDYWAANLASHGYVVVSIGANGINAADDAVDDAGANARAQLIAAHLQLWTAFVETDEYGTTYNGAVDLQNVGLVGHSRGGEGVAAYFGYAAEQGLGYGVRAALLLAPTDFNRFELTGVPLAVMVPYCDGDVFDLMGVHYYDDSRHALVGDAAPKYVFEMAGSNHNFYNTVWSPGTYPDGGAVDDFAYLASAIGQDDGACGAGSALRLDEGEQQQSFVAYANAFFRTHLGGEDEYVDALRGDLQPFAGAAAAAVRTSYMPPDAASDRLVINRIVDDGSLQTNDLGAPVEADALSGYGLCGIGPDGGIDNYSHCVTNPGMFMGELVEGREPHAPGLAQLRLGFADLARWTNALPEGTDVSGFTALQFRAAVDFEDPADDGSTVEFSVALVDRNGTRATVGPRSWTDPLSHPLGTLYPIVPKLLLHGIRIPLADFTASAPELDLADLAAIELVFDGGTGAILLSDLLFADALPPPPSGTDSGGSTGDGSSSSGAVVDDSGGSGSASGATTGLGDGTAASTGGEGSSDSGAAQQRDEGGCGCNGTGSTALWPMLVVVARRRRRARR